ncbi:4347_t:CDS:2 [Paraglomus brasilianum]|uniref:4347_t:CDS:1 n=1 Tax=Paraglomus brasilianum TaxID=144538 RepID=A0A9N9DDH6_9GLOM|nr:4347_t:CDS:2 [Paraglomus brasilianum]
MLATLAISSPIPELDERAPPVINVPSAGPDSRTIGSTQNVNGVIIKIKDLSGKAVNTFFGINANSGSSDFLIDPKWAKLGVTYVVEVSTPSAKETSSQFTVFKTLG